MAVGFASYASAAEVKKDTKKAPVVAAKTMTDADMDKVTAGASSNAAYQYYPYSFCNNNGCHSLNSNGWENGFRGGPS